MIHRLLEVIFPTKFFRTGNELVLEIKSCVKVKFLEKFSSPQMFPKECYI